MSTPVGFNLNSLPGIVLRPETPADEAFLSAVFASTREEELALTSWDAATRRAFLDQQFAAMRRGYRDMFPAAQFLILELNGTPAGRLVLHETPQEVRVVDLALLPAQRNQGVGTRLLRAICSSAPAPVRLSVVKFNRAIRWYERLGFVKVGEMGFHDELEWRPPER